VALPAIETRSAFSENSLGEVLAELLGCEWEITVDSTWAHATPMGRSIPVQGWKLHVSATVVSAEEMIRACAPVLMAAGCAFKVAQDLDVVRQLTDPHIPRQTGGKILTAYPPSDAASVDLGAQLDGVTTHLQGPRILSDRPVRAGSVVHYRYGVFTGVDHIDHDGMLSRALLAPDGAVVLDRRDARFAPPPWAENPFPAPEPSSGTVLLNGRYVPRVAIRHAYRGGVYRAVDQRTGDTVIVKQARAHVATDLDGRDARHWLRHEARVLDTVQAAGWTPAAIEVFEQDGDLFLVEQDLGGRKLTTWIKDGVAGDVVTRPGAETHAMVVDIAAMLADLHRIGVVVQDLTPNNILVTDSGRPALVDLEFAALPDGAAPTLAGTPGYEAPEQAAGAATDPAFDSYALGATMLACYTGEPPDLGDQSVPEWLAVGIRRAACPDAVADLAVRLCAIDPQQRPTVAAALTRLRAITPSRAPMLPETALIDAAVANVEPIAESVADEAIDQLLHRLVAELDFGADRLVAPSAKGESTTPTNVYHGAAGLLGVLTQAWRLRGDDALRDPVARAAQWLENTVVDGGPVGLYFGAAGPCWALADAGRALGDEAMVRRAVDRARMLPLDGPMVDVTHGLAGLGLTLLHLLEVSGDQRLVEAVVSVSDELLRRSETDEAGIAWRVPADVESAAAGIRYYGFAHGAAGIGFFLLGAARATGNARARQAADQVRRTLEQAADLQHGCATWTATPDAADRRLSYWCHGATGVAVFLVHAGANDVVDAAARSVLATKWQSGISYCHGLAGNADVLLELGDPYSSWAADLLHLMWQQRTADDRGTGLGDDRTRITADFSTGYAGGLSALLRLRHGGPALWLPHRAEEVTPQEPITPMTSSSITTERNSSA